MRVLWAVEEEMFHRFVGVAAGWAAGAVDPFEPVQVLVERRMAYSQLKYSTGVGSR
jgi:hypothetical protein